MRQDRFESAVVPVVWIRRWRLVPGEYWYCLGCGRRRPWNYRCIPGEYPEDGEVFCSKGCRTAYERKDPALYKERAKEREKS